MGLAKRCRGDFTQPPACAPCSIIGQKTLELQHHVCLFLPLPWGKPGTWIRPPQLFCLLPPSLLPFPGNSGRLLLYSGKQAGGFYLPPPLPPLCLVHKPTPLPQSYCKVLYVYSFEWCPGEQPGVKALSLMAKMLFLLSKPSKMLRW